LGACAGEANASPPASPQAWIDAPLPGSTHPLGVIEIVSHSSAGEGVAQVELSVDGSVVRLDIAPATAGQLVLMSQYWTPPGAGTYMLQVRAQASGGEWSSPATTQITVGETAQEAPTEDAPGGQPTPTPGETAVAAATATGVPTGPLTFTLTQNAFCRQGPGREYMESAVFTAGDVVEIRGKNQDDTWYYVYWQVQNVSCWVAASTGVPSGGVEGVAVLAAPPTPIPPTSTAVTDSGGGTGSGGIVAEAPTNSGTTIYNISGCGDPSTLTVRVKAVGATQARIDYVIQGVAYSAQMEDRGEGVFRFVMQSGPQYAGNSGPMTYIIVASNASESVTINQVAAIDVLNCKP
jgi:hypothetical protein